MQHRAVSLLSKSSDVLSSPGESSGRKHLGFTNHKYFWLSSEEVDPENVQRLTFFLLLLSLLWVFDEERCYKQRQVFAFACVRLMCVCVRFQTLIDHLSLSVSQPGKQKKKFSSFFKSLVIELDKDLYGPDNHLVEVSCRSTEEEAHLRTAH